MVVEKDQGIRDLTVNALSYCVNRDVIAFEDGLKAWQYLEDGNRADLVIAEADLPGMDGLTFLEKFKARWTAGVFILTSDREEPGAEARASGADAFLVKPYTINDLFAIVQQFVVNG